MNINSEQLGSARRHCFETIINRIETQEKPLGNRELLTICGEAADFRGGNADPHFAHEIAEAVLNLLIKKRYAKTLLAASDPAEAVRDVLKPLASRLPTQTWRSREQVARQQFSTPPSIAYLVSYLLNFQTGEIVLEPSAGTGCLAVWSSGSELSTHTNEIDARRRELLNNLGFAPTAHNAEFIHDFLTPEISPDCLLMNPPFSSNGGRTAHNSSRFGFRHVESALERLKKDGKFGIILGEAAGLETKTGNEFWYKTSGKISVKAIFRIAGREYYKNGTSVDINLVVGIKRAEEQAADWRRERERIVNVSAESVEDAFDFARKLNLRLE